MRKHDLIFCKVCFALISNLQAAHSLTMHSSLKSLCCNCLLLYLWPAELNAPYSSLHCKHRRPTFWVRLHRSGPTFTIQVACTAAFAYCVDGPWRWQKTHGRDAIENPSMSRSSPPLRSNASINLSLSLLCLLRHSRPASPKSLCSHPPLPKTYPDINLEASCT